MRKITVHTNCSDIDGALEHDYDITSDGESITEMYQSSNKEWTRPEEKIVTCTEYDDGYKLKLREKKLTIDTVEAYELYILLAYLFKEDKIEYRESTVIKTI